VGRHRHYLGRFNGRGKGTRVEGRPDARGWYLWGEGEGGKGALGVGRRTETSERAMGGKELVRFEKKVK